MEEQFKWQFFLEYANEAAENIRKIHRVLGGGEPIPEYGSLLGNVYYLVTDMIQEYLSVMEMRVANDDEFNNMTTEIMFAEKDEIRDIIKKYLE